MPLSIGAAIQPPSGTDCRVIQLSGFEAPQPCELVDLADLVKLNRRPVAASGPDVLALRWASSGCGLRHQPELTQQRDRVPIVVDAADLVPAISKTLVPRTRNDLPVLGSPGLSPYYVPVIVHSTAPRSAPTTAAVSSK